MATTATLDALMSEDLRRQLDRMERLLESQAVLLERHGVQLDDLDGKLDQINGTVRSHEQTLHGPGGRGGGLVDDVRAVKEALRVPWRAVGAIAAVASVVVALVFGFLAAA